MLKSKISSLFVGKFSAVILFSNLLLSEYLFRYSLLGNANQMLRLFTAAVKSISSFTSSFSIPVMMLIHSFTCSLIYAYSSLFIRFSKLSGLTLPHRIIVAIVNAIICILSIAVHVHIWFSERIIMSIPWEIHFSFSFLFISPFKVSIILVFCSMSKSLFMKHCSWLLNSM